MSLNLVNTKLIGRIISHQPSSIHSLVVPTKSTMYSSRSFMTYSRLTRSQSLFSSTNISTKSLRSLSQAHNLSKLSLSSTTSHYRSYSILSYFSFTTTPTSSSATTTTTTVTTATNNTITPNPDTPLLNATVNLIEKLNKDIPLTTTTIPTPTPINPSNIVTNGTYPDFSILTDTLNSETGLRGMTWEVIQWLHNIGGLEYWAAIAMASLGLRFAVLPLFIKAVKTGAWLQHHNEAIMQFSQQMAQAQEKKNVEELRRIFADRKNFMSKNKLQMRWVVLPSLVQIPVFIAFFGTLRTMAREAHLLPGMLEGGTAWFPLLYLPDPTGILPLLSAILSVLAIRINNNMQGIPQLDLTPGGQKLIFGGLSVIFNLFTLSLPAAVQIYIMVTSATMVIQQGMLRIPILRRIMGFPSDWPIPSHIFAERAKKRAVMGDNVNPVVSNMRNFQPWFRRASEIAAGNYNAPPKHEYVTITGLRNPGIPLPPPLTSLPKPISTSTNTVIDHKSTISDGATTATSSGNSSTTNTASSSTSTTTTSTPVYSTQRPKKKSTKELK